MKHLWLNDLDPIPPLGDRVPPKPPLGEPDFVRLPHNPQIVRRRDGKLETSIAENEGANAHRLIFDEQEAGKVTASIKGYFEPFPFFKASDVPVSKPYAPLTPATDQEVRAYFKDRALGRAILVEDEMKFWARMALRRGKFGLSLT